MNPYKLGLDKNPANYVALSPLSFLRRVAEVYPDLVAHSADGQIETVKYQVLDSMLLNEVQKRYQHAQQQDATIQQQQEQIRNLETRLAALEALLSGKASTTATAVR